VDDNCPFLGSQVFSYCIEVSGISADAGPDISVGCNSNVTLNATATGGSGNYSYSWNNGVNGPVLTGGPGTYIVNVSDGSCSDKDTVQILAGPNTPTAAFSMDFNCSGLGVQFTNQSGISGGSITAYSWNFGDGNTSSAVSPLHTYTSTGNYQVMLIAQGAGGCLDTVIQTLNLTNDQPLADFSLHNACVGDQINFTDQSNSISAVSVYSWDFGDANGSSVSNPAHIYLIPGTYTVKLYIENANACADSITKQLTVYPLPLASAGSDLSLCEGDTVQLNGTGGISQTWNPGNHTGANLSLSPSTSITYTLSVSDANGCIGEDLVSITVNPKPILSPMPDQDICPGETVTLIPNPVGASSLSWMPGGSTGNQLSVSPLIPTSYYLTATSNAGCVSRDTVSVHVFDLPVLSLSATDAACSGAPDGIAEVQVLSGTSPYQYNWAPSGGSSAQAGGLVAGIYSVTVTDANGCTETDSIVISEPQAIVISESSTSASCFGSADGSATVSVSGGIPGYTYLWNNGAGTTATLTGIPAGNYTISVTDANGCSVSKNISVIQPSAVSLLTTSAAVLCHGTSTGSVTVNASGGTPNYSYNWTGLSSTNSTVNALAAGTYEVTVIDNNACSASASIIVTEPAPIQLSSSTSPAACSTSGNGSATVTAGGGSGAFSYQWSPMGGTNATANGLVPGNYTVTVTDANGCTSDTNVIVGSIGGPQIAQQSVNDVSCYGGNDGSAIISVHAGTAPYSIQWSPAVSSGTNASNLSAGTYTIHVSDMNQCLATHQLVVSQPDLLASSYTKNDVSCFGLSNGSAEVRVAGGTQPYTYSWTPNTGGSPNPQNLPAGNYSVTITDANACTNSISLTITEPAELTAQLSVTDLRCNGDSSGAVSVQVNGGTPSYSYFWSPGGSGGTGINGLAGGTYQVRITDFNGCTLNAQALVIEPDPLQLSIDPVNTLCIGQTAQLLPQISGGIAPYTWLWNTGSSDSSLVVSPVLTNHYSLRAWDANGCPSATVSTAVPVFPPLSVTASDVQVICEGDEAYVSAVASGGNGGPYTYSWNQGNASGNSVAVFPESDSVFIVVVSDACGTPLVSDSAYVVVHPLPAVAFLPHFIDGCTPVNAAFNNLSIAPAGSLFHWSFGNNQFSSESNPEHLYTEPGVYDVSLTVISPEGCEASHIVPEAVRVYAYPEASFSQSAHETTVMNPAITFYDESENAVYIEWDFGDGSPLSFEQNPQHEFPDSGTYVIRQVVSSAGGCLDTVYSTLRVEMEFIIHVPNAFSPNGDGINDGFIARGIGYSEYSMWILDRWGKKIFNSNDREKAWDGTFFNNGNQCQADVYEWVLDVLDFKGTTHRLIGHVTLFR
jgi:gliding motility-associated-like protein